MQTAMIKFWSKSSGKVLLESKISSYPRPVLSREIICPTDSNFQSPLPSESMDTLATVLACIFWTVAR